MEVKVARVNVRKYGGRGYELSLPRVWVEDLKLESGDEIDIYRTDNDELVIRPVHEREALKEEQSV